MKIGLVACYRKSYRDPFSAYLALSSLENLFQTEGHDTHVFSDLYDPALVEAMDKVVLLGNPFEEPQSPLPQWLISIKPQLVQKIVLLGVRDFKAESTLEEHKNVLAAIASNHPIGVCDRASREQLSQLLNKNASVLTAMPAFWNEGYAFRLKKKTRLMIPAFSDPVFSKHPRAYANLVAKFYRRWGQTTTVLYAGTHADCLNLAAPVGECTFFQPTAPVLLLNALISSDAVIAGHATPLQAAVQNQVPGILLSNDACEKAMAEALGIPYLEMHLNSQAAELAHRAEELMSRYPWEAVKQKSAALMDKTLESLAEAGLVKKSAAVKKRGAAPVGERHWATVAGQHNLPQVLGWVENVLSIYPGRNQFHILCASRSVEASLEASLRPGSWHAYPLKALWNEDEWQSCRRFSKPQLLVASKPKFLLRALEQAKAEIFYSDPEVVFFRDPVELVTQADVSACLVARYPDSSHDCARNGIYTPALFSVQPLAEPFLNWWASFSLQPRSAGLRVDGFLETKLLDSAPLLFPSIKVLREPGTFSESGNIESTSTYRNSWPGDTVHHFGGAKVAAFRCGGVDNLGVHEIKTGWDQLASVFIQNRKVFEYDSLRRAIWLQQRPHWRRLDLFFCAKQWLESHIPLLAHEPSSGEVRFFTFGLGRLPVKIAQSLGLLAPPLATVRERVSRPDPSNQLWKTWQQTLLRRFSTASDSATRHTQVA